MNLFRIFFKHGYYDLEGLSTPHPSEVHLHHPEVEGEDGLQVDLGALTPGLLK